VPDIVALIQLVGATLAELESPTCTAVEPGDTVPASASAVPTVPILGGLVIATLAPEPTVTAAETACTEGVAVCSAQM
jgi:hypothetical protein